MNITTMCHNFFYFFGKIFSKNFISLKGRMSRQTYSGFSSCFILILFVVLLLTVILLITSGTNFKSLRPNFLATGSVLLIALYFLFFIFILIYTICVGARRLHDMGLSGWYMLLTFIPIISAFLTLTLWTRRGTPGPNRFGEDPLLPVEKDYIGPDDEFLFNPYGIIDEVAGKYFPGFFFSTKGRLSCREYYFGFATTFLAPLMLDALIGTPLTWLNKLLELPFLTPAIALCMTILMIGGAISFLSLSIRRNHDFGLSGWYILLILVPVLNLIYLFNLAVISGDYGENKYGPPHTIPTETPDLYLNDNY